MATGNECTGKGQVQETRSRDCARHQMMGTWAKATWAKAKAIEMGRSGRF